VPGPMDIDALKSGQKQGKPQRKPISDGVRYRVLRRDRFRCVFCGAKAGDVELQVDHLWPVSKGGGNEEWNLASACKRCNSGKRAAAEREFEVRYEFLKGHFAVLSDEPDPRVRARLENAHRKVVNSQILWMDHKAMLEALTSIEIATRFVQ
jgi:HNH endonuclease